jgi:hypothetical protein
MIRTLIFASIVLVTICGCSGDSKPMSYVKDVTSLCSLQSADRIKIYDIKQINGVKKVIDGRDIYDLEFEASIEFLDSIWWAKDGFSTVGISQIPNTETHISDSYKGLDLILKGDKRRVTGSYRYEITDNGWRPVDDFNKKGVLKKEDNSISPYGYLFFVENMIVNIYNKANMVYYTELYRVINSSAKNTGASESTQRLVDKFKSLDPSTSNHENVCIFIETVEKELREMTNQRVPDSELDIRKFKKDIVKNDARDSINLMCIELTNMTISLIGLKSDSSSLQNDINRLGKELGLKPQP